MVAVVYRGFAAALLGAACTLLAAHGWAEPYLAVRSGLPCSSCHVNATGGGLRTAFGNAYGRTELSISPLMSHPEEFAIPLPAALRVGGNARYSARQFDLEDTDGDLEFNTDRVTLYGYVQLNDALGLYVDQQVAPGGSLNRETWARLMVGQWYLKAGTLFLPYGWRLEDDTAFVRESTGINFSSADEGVEVGYDSASWQLQLAVTNGAGGGGEVDDGKFFTLRGSWINALGQIGLSAGRNNTDFADRTLYGVFAGFNTGPVTWLLEYDRVEDEAAGVEDFKLDLALLEANWLVARGHNIKLSLEHQAVDGEDRDRLRSSLVWEFFPWSHTQFRSGIRSRNSDDQTFPEGEEYFLQLHVYF